MGILVDIDNVLAKFIEPFLEFYNERSENPSTTDTLLNSLPDKISLILEEFYKTGALMKLELEDGAVEGIEKLSEIDDLHVGTSRHLSAMRDTLRYIIKHFDGKFKTVNTTDYNRRHTKYDLCKMLDCDIMIEDEMRHIEGIKDISIIVYTQPWNSLFKLGDNCYRANNWDDIVAIAKELRAVRPRINL